MAKVTLSFPEEKIALITLSDPATLNAMGEDMAQEFAQSIAQIEVLSEKPRVLILTGEGKAFSAGGDLTMLYEKTKLSREENYKRMIEFYTSFLGFRSLEIPTIAVLNGAAVGAGLCVACAMDIRIAEESGKLGFTFTKLGLHPGMAATYFLPKVIGESHARELLLTGRIISSQEALRRGLVSEVVKDGDGVGRAIEIAKEILQTGPIATKDLLHTLDSIKDTLEDTLAHEARSQAENYAGAEFLEGISAVREKRKAKF